MGAVEGVGGGTVARILAWGSCSVSVWLKSWRRRESMYRDGFHIAPAITSIASASFPFRLNSATSDTVPSFRVTRDRAVGWHR